MTIDSTPGGPTSTAHAPVTAKQLGIARLFHYQTFDRKRLADLLLYRRIFCSDPAKFNDPWDCKPSFDMDAMDDPAVRAQTAQWLIEGQLGGPRGDKADDDLRSDLPLLKEMVRRAGLKVTELVSQKWRVYCLGPCPTLNLMWSHYAAGHTGVCLEFSTDNSVFSQAQKVFYKQEYPRWLLHGEKLELEILQTKSDEWSYEDEYRLTCPIFTDISDHPLLLRKGFLGLPPGALLSVIVGCQGDEAAVKRIVDKCAPGLPVKRAIRSANRYQLAIEDTANSASAR
jgi:hypothetical protein